MPDFPVSLSAVDEVLRQIGYRLIKDQNEIRHYSYGDPPIAVILDFREMLTWSAVEKALEVNGINLDLFHAFLESL